ncbi:hypothetical protein KP509_17G019400 [Ceratopteris richardii]|uniref:Uncharacterized protein n=1 Tax=Ceratopteris richardii TaxID=49495 RepID=A0A8T2SSK8_CERRI|nr:hypothetical protein KP509_17G019400 [Ceratopteris richardii]
MQSVRASMCEPAMIARERLLRTEYPIKIMQIHPRSLKRASCLVRGSLLKAENGSDDEQPKEHRITDLQLKVIDMVKSYPWGKMCWRFLHRAQDLAWIGTKWVEIPLFVLSTLSEIVYTLSVGKESCIPLGIVMGFMLSKVVGNACLDVMQELQDARITWPLVLLAFFFILLKLPSPYYPSWAAAFLPHVANAGLLKTVFLIRDSQRISVGQ